MIGTGDPPYRRDSPARIRPQGWAGTERGIAAKIDRLKNRASEQSTVRFGRSGLAALGLFESRSVADTLEVIEETEAV